SSFAGIVVSGVDGFLRVTASFGEHLAHYARHLAGIVFFASDENFGSAEDDLRAARRGHEPPLGKGTFGGVYGGVNIGLRRLLEDADHVARVGGIGGFESPTGAPSR